MWLWGISFDTPLITPLHRPSGSSQFPVLCLGKYIDCESNRHKYIGSETVRASNVTDGNTQPVACLKYLGRVSKIWEVIYAMRFFLLCIKQFDKSAAGEKGTFRLQIIHELEYFYQAMWKARLQYQSVLFRMRQNTSLKSRNSKLKTASIIYERNAPNKWIKAHSVNLCPRFMDSNNSCC